MIQGIHSGVENPIESFYWAYCVQLGRRKFQPYRSFMKLLAALLFTGAPCLAAEWMRLQAGPFELYTDAGARTGLQVIQRLEETRRVFSRQWKQPQLPLRVVVLNSEAEFRTLRPSDSTRAFFQSGPERDYIVIYAGDSIALRAAAHEYVHVILHRTSVHLPQWLEEGLADFYSTVEVTPAGARLGRAVPGHVEVLRHFRWLPAETLLGVRQQSPEYNEASKAGVFYAESWALVHMLMFSPSWRDGMADFLSRLAGEEPQEAAFETAFGKPFAKALDDLSSYVERGRFDTSTITEVDEKTAERPVVDRLTALEGRLTSAGIALLGGQTDEARRLYQSIARDYPDSPLSSTGLATLALQRRDYSSARRLLARAIEQGASDASTFLEYAMLVRDTRGKPAEVRAWLEKAAAANPRHPEVQFLLGLMAASRDDPTEAIRRYRAALDADPRQSSFWHALAMTYVETGQRSEAAMAARNALLAAAAPHEVEMARAAVKLAGAEPPAPRPARKAAGVVVPGSWKPRKADYRLQGVLTEVECGPNGVRFHVEGAPARKTVVLLATRPNDIELKNAPGASREFSCGTQVRVPVIVEYTAGDDLVSVEFLAPQ